jgi:SSS family transporter
MFIIAYMVITIGIGLWASLRVRNSVDFVVAGRSLPIYMVVTTVFATWFGSEAVLGIPAAFAEEGLGGIVADPFGAGLCLIFVGIFFAAKLYRQNLLTIADFFRNKYGRKVELLVSCAICISYLGWVSAQIVALGLVINIVSDGAVSFNMGMVIGLVTVMLYTVTGGMWAIVYTDFFQIILIIIGLGIVAYLVAGRFDGGVMEVVNHAAANNKFKFWPEMKLESILSFVGAFVTLALGSIPQQDVFQRVMSGKSEKVAVRGTVIGGSFYIIFCFVPIFITYAAILLNPELAAKHIGGDGDTQRILPEFIMSEVPIFVQVTFFGALLSAIMSTASGTLLAPAAIFAENILKKSAEPDLKKQLRALRYSVFGFGFIVFAYAYYSANSGLSIFEMVENAYLVTLCGAFVPLAFGVYWKSSNRHGALASIFLGVGTWAILEGYSFTLPADQPLIMPPQLAGLFMAILGMIVGSKMYPEDHSPTELALEKAGKINRKKEDIANREN